MEFIRASLYTILEQNKKKIKRGPILSQDLEVDGYIFPQRSI